MKNSSKIMLGVLAGAAAGTIAGILIAPDRGENTRKKVSDSSNKFKEDMNSKLQQSVDRMNSLTESAFNLVNDYKEKFKKESQDQNIPVQNQDNNF